MGDPNNRLSDAHSADRILRKQRRRLRQESGSYLTEVAPLMGARDYGDLIRIVSARKLRRTERIAFEEDS